MIVSDGGWSVESGLDVDGLFGSGLGEAVGEAGGGSADGSLFAAGGVACGGSGESAESGAFDVGIRAGAEGCEGEEEEELHSNRDGVSIFRRHGHLSSSGFDLG